MSKKNKNLFRDLPKLINATAKILDMLPAPERPAPRHYRVIVNNPDPNVILLN